jgi:hypothetical protein
VNVGMEITVSGCWGLFQSFMCIAKHVILVCPNCPAPPNNIKIVPSSSIQSLSLFIVVSFFLPPCQILVSTHAPILE